MSQASTSARQHGFAGWFGTIGFLEFEQSPTPDTTLASIMAFDAIDGYVNTLDFRLVRYALNGTYLGYQNLTTQLQLCGGHYDTMTRWMQFGVQYVNSCNLRIESIITNSDEMEFYDPYFVDADDTWYPIPVMVSNIRRNGIRVLSLIHI